MRGKLQISENIMKSDLGAHIKSLKPGMYDWEIVKYNKVRSNAENRYYHGVVLELLSEYTGYTADEMHDILKAMFLSEKQRLKWDKRKKIQIQKSTSTLTTVQFEKFLEDVRRWAASELGCYIPNPNEPPSWMDDNCFI